MRKIAYFRRDYRNGYTHGIKTIVFAEQYAERTTAVQRSVTFEFRAYIEGVFVVTEIISLAGNRIHCRPGIFFQIDCAFCSVEEYLLRFVKYYLFGIRKYHGVNFSGNLNSVDRLEYNVYRRLAGIITENVTLVEEIQNTVFKFIIFYRNSVADDADDFRTGKTFADSQFNVRFFYVYYIRNDYFDYFGHYSVEPVNVFKVDGYITAVDVISCKFVYGFYVHDACFKYVSAESVFFAATEHGIQFGIFRINGKIFNRIAAERFRRDKTYAVRPDAEITVGDFYFYVFDKRIVDVIADNRLTGLVYAAVYDKFNVSDRRAAAHETEQPVRAERRRYRMTFSVEYSAESVFARKSDVANGGKRVERYIVLQFVVSVISLRRYGKNLFQFFGGRNVLRYDQYGNLNGFSSVGGINSDSQFPFSVNARKIASVYRRKRSSEVCAVKRNSFDRVVADIAEIDGIVGFCDFDNLPFSVDVHNVVRGIVGKHYPFYIFNIAVRYADIIG